MNLTTFYLAVAGLILAPLVGGLVAGLDRVVTARLQSRMGPPLLQPFYDVGKLMSKVIPPASQWQGLFVRWALVASLASDVLLAAGGDVLMCFFIQAASACFVALGAFSGSSPYSKLGAQRELFQMLSYEPIFLVCVLCMICPKAAGICSRSSSTSTPTRRLASRNEVKAMGHGLSRASQATTMAVYP